MTESRAVSMLNKLSTMQLTQLHPQALFFVCLFLEMGSHMPQAGLELDI